MIPSLSTGRMVELAAAILIFAAGVYFYRRTDRRGSQGAVIMFVVALIMAIHALGLLDYHPTRAEADMFNGRGR